MKTRAAVHKKTAEKPNWPATQPPSREPVMLPMYMALWFQEKTRPVTDAGLFFVNRVCTCGKRQASPIPMMKVPNSWSQRPSG